METRTQLSQWPAEARKGADAYRFIRTKIWECRLKGIEPKRVWISTHGAARLHAMWSYVALQYDMILPAVVDRVPVSIGNTGGHDFLFEYHTDGAANEAALNPAGDNPLPDND